MVEPDNIVRVPDLCIATALGTEAVLALLSPLFGVGWAYWVVYLFCATAGLLVSMRFLWSR
jgi:hypothetical protein